MSEKPPGFAPWRPMSLSQFIGQPILGLNLFLRSDKRRTGDQVRTPEEESLECFRPFDDAPAPGS